MKQFIFALLLSASAYLNAQTFSQNQDKYWAYRDRMRKNFTKIGAEPGESIPISARSIGFAFDGAPATASGNKPSRIYYADATIYLGHYVSVVATEIKLLKDQIGNTNSAQALLSLNNQLLAAKNELYFSLLAINRLDFVSEYYLSEHQNTLSPDDLNGLLLRDDVPENFHEKFISDYSEIFDRSCDFIRTDSEANPLRVWSHDENGALVTAGEQLNFSNGNIMSLDQITTLFTGLTLVYDLVDETIVQPTLADTPMNLRAEAKSIVHRILNYIVRQEETPGNDPAYSFTIRDVNGRMNLTSSDISAEAPFIYSIGRHFDYPLFNSWASTGLNNIKIAIMMDSPSLKQKLVDLAWTTNLAFGYLIPPAMVGMFNINVENYNVPISVHIPCYNALINRLNEKGNDPINVATIPLSKMMILIDEFEVQSIPYTTNVPQLCFNLSSEITGALSELDINIQGMLCDNLLLTPVSDIVRLVATIASVGLIVNDPLLANYVFTAWIYNQNEEPDFCINTSGNNFVSEDNVHIIQELATVSQWLGATYIRDISNASGLNYYTMIRALLQPSSGALSLVNRSYIEQQFLNTAPCEGPWASTNFEGSFEDLSDPSLYCAPNNWASQNRLFHANNSLFGPNDKSFRGEFSGLDYMLYYNLYHLLWANELPPYKREMSCACVQEITPYDEIWNQLNVNRKFPDYKAKGIPIESYLAHGLNVSSATGLLFVKNDLIVCRENANVQTVLKIDNNASLELYAGNTITVKAGNKIHLSSNAKLKAGLPNFEGEFLPSTIILEENAELLVDANASIACFGGLNLIMRAGSKFTLINASCGPNATTDNGIYFQADNAIINVVNSLMVSNRVNGHSTSSFTNCSFTADNSTVSFTRSNSSLYEAVADGTTFDFQGNSSFNVSLDFRIDHGSITFGGHTHLNIVDGVLTIGDASVMHWYASQCRIVHADSKLVFDKGQLRIPSEKTFTFTYDNEMSGYIEVLPGTENMLINEHNSTFMLNGSGYENLMLRINDGAHMQNAVFGAGQIILQNCKVDLTNDGAIWTDMAFVALNVNFLSHQNIGKVHTWFTGAFYDGCKTQSIDINSHWCKLNMRNSFVNYSSLNVEGGNYILAQDEFDHSYMKSQMLQSVSRIFSSNFVNDGRPQIYGNEYSHFIVEDESDVEIAIVSSSFNAESSGGGIYKLGGLLTLRCCLFEECSYGLLASKGVTVNMSASGFAGFNKFIDCDVMIYCDNAYNVNINKGNNDFSQVVTAILEGNIMMYSCIFNELGCQEPELPANYNKWPLGQSPPGYPINDLHAIPSTGCSSAMHNTCQMLIIDSSPVSTVACSNFKPLVEIKKSLTSTIQIGQTDLLKEGVNTDVHSPNGWLKDLDINNPSITTTNFDHVLFEDALLVAANYSELVDSVGNDSISIDLFHQVLTSELDRTNGEIRWKMLWGLRFMKSTLENRFVQSEITAAQNEAAFHPDVQKYVDVLNVMTDDNVSDTTFKQQFYFELDKGQVFRTIGNPEMAYELFDRLDDCNLDSLEQSVLNLWLTQTIQELQIEEQYMLGLTIDSTSLLVDSTQFSTPTEYSSNEYYFGATITGPNSVTFTPCNHQNRSFHYAVSKPNFAVYPSPTDGELNIVYSGEDDFTLLQVLSSSGELLIQQSKFLKKGEAWRICDRTELSSGMYFVKLSNSSITENCRVIVR